MKYLDAYRDPREALDLIDEISRIVSRPWTLLDVCGGQAHNLVRFGSDRVLPADLELIHGPGCSVSALPPETLLREGLRADPTMIVCAPGDLLRVPIGRDSLHAARERGGDVRVVYSPLDGLALARKHPDRHVIVLAVGFETTAPAAAAAVLEADRLALDNFMLLTGFFRIEAAVEAMLATPGIRTHAVLAPGPVAAVSGLHGYEPLADRFGVPVVVTGPEPVDLLDAIHRAVRQLEAETHSVENQYVRAVRPDGNPQARAAIATVFEPSDADWRGLGKLPASGLALRPRYRRFDAAARLPAPSLSSPSPADCPDGEILAGRLKPVQCPAFGGRCTPDHPLGAAMVSAEGTCAAYFRYRRPADNSQAAPALSVLPSPVAPRG